MRRIEGGDLATLAALHERRHAAIDPAFRAVCVHDVGTHGGDGARHREDRRDIAGADRARHRYPNHAEREIGSQRRYPFFLERTAGRGIADEADSVPGPVLRVGEVGDVAKDAADRAASDMDDVDIPTQFIGAFPGAISNLRCAKAA